MSHYQNNEYNNTVIKAVTEKEETQALDWWEKNGVNVSSYRGWQPSITRCIYYGLINGIFSNYSMATVQKHNAKVINSPGELLNRGDKILVWDIDEAGAVERTFAGYVEGAISPILTIKRGEEFKLHENVPFYYTSWKHWKPLPKKPIVEVTPQEIAKLMGIDIEQLRIKG